MEDSKSRVVSSCVQVNVQTKFLIIHRNRLFYLSSNYKKRPMLILFILITCACISSLK